jgi:hypothetical protein
MSDKFYGLKTTIDLSTLQALLNKAAGSDDYERWWREERDKNDALELENSKLKAERDDIERWWEESVVKVNELTQKIDSYKNTENVSQ